MAEYQNRFQCERFYKIYSRHILSVPLMLMITIGLVSLTSASPLHTPAPGTNERRAILDVERKYVEDAVAVKPVAFHDVSISVKNGWAFIISHPRDAAGHKLWAFAQSKDPSYDPVAMTLVQKTRTGWKLVSFSFVQTWRDYLQFRKEKPAAPPEIFSSAIAAWRPPPQKADGWTLVRQFQGGTDNLQTNTETFKVGSQWRIDWTTEEGDAGDKGSMTVFVSVAPNTPDTEAAGLAISHYGGGSGRTLEYGAGKYYLQIVSNQHYVLRVSSHN